VHAIRRDAAARSCCQRLSDVIEVVCGNVVIGDDGVPVRRCALLDDAQQLREGA
jgi:hypothetical protein